MTYWSSITVLAATSEKLNSSTDISRSYLGHENIAPGFCLIDFLTDYPFPQIRFIH